MIWVDGIKAILTYSGMKIDQEDQKSGAATGQSTRRYSVAVRFHTHTRTLVCTHFTLIFTITHTAHTHAQVGAAVARPPTTKQDAVRMITFGRNVSLWLSTGRQQVFAFFKPDPSGKGGSSRFDCSFLVLP